MKTPLKLFLDRTKQSEAAFAKDCGCSRTAMNNYVKGKETPGLELALVICKRSGWALFPQDLLTESLKYSEPGEDFSGEPEPDVSDLM